jgi:adenylate cyclase
VRVLRSFAFLDLCGFTDFADTHGDDEALAAVTVLRSVVRTVAPDHGVRIDKWLGDGVMLVGVERDPLLLAAVEAVEQIRVSASPLRLRAGVAGGDVLLVEGDDYLGRPVNLAARLCSQARPDEALVDADFFIDIPSELQSHCIGAVAIRGFAQAVRLSSVTGFSLGGTKPAGIEAVTSGSLERAVLLEDRLDH